MKKCGPWLASWLALLCAIASSPVHAVDVELTLPSKLVAKAEFHQGEPDKPAVILLHGFLQTHQFPTINRLTDGLASEGYTVLAPTLSLGLPNRAQGMACEAVHNHTLNDDVEELYAWVKWLKAKKVKKIVLGGHSLGNVVFLDYLAKHPDSSVRKLIGISIVEGSLKSGESSRVHLVQELRRKVREGKKDIQENQFSFCQQFRSTPKSILSYLEWGPDRILMAIQKTKIPVTMIMGSKDDRLGPDWVERLKKTKAKVITIEGANHFMGGQYEFDLYDIFLAELDKTDK